MLCQSGREGQSFVFMEISVFKINRFCGKYFLYAVYSRRFYAQRLLEFVVHLEKAVNLLNISVQGSWDIDQKKDWRLIGMNASGLFQKTGLVKCYLGKTHYCIAS